MAPVPSHFSLHAEQWFYKCYVLTVQFEAVVNSKQRHQMLKTYQTRTNNYLETFFNFWCIFFCSSVKTLTEHRHENNAGRSFCKGEPLSLNSNQSNFHEQISSEENDL